MLYLIAMGQLNEFEHHLVYYWQNVELLLEHGFRKTLFDQNLLHFQQCHLFGFYTVSYTHLKHTANGARDQDAEQFEVARPFPENWKQRPREKRSSGSRCKRRQAAAESACDKMCWMRQEEAERWWFKACLDQNDRILCELWARSVRVLSLIHI